MNMMGKNIILRPIKLEDADMLCKWKNDEGTYMYLGGGYQPISPDQYGKWMDSIIDLTGVNRRFIIESAQHKAIGIIGLYGINWIHRTCEVGAFIGEDSFKGKGYAGEAYLLLEEYAKKYLNLRKITLKAVADNVRAIAFWHKMGYTDAGVLKEERFINGKYCDLVIMEKMVQIPENSGGGVRFFQ